jgi:Uma2 family endonuclease
MTLTHDRPIWTELFPSPGDWSEADYWAVAERGRLVELSDGNLEVSPKPTYLHQLVVMRLAAALLALTAQHHGFVCTAPLPVRLWPGKIREPDVMFMSAAHADRIGSTWGPPDLAVEVVSPGTERTDREVKRSEYAKADVTEYWIIDPVARTVEKLQLPSGEAAYRAQEILAADDDLSSAMFPGLYLALADLFAEP